MIANLADQLSIIKDVFLKKKKGEEGGGGVSKVKKSLFDSIQSDQASK